MIKNTDFAPRVIISAGIAVPMKIRARLLKYSIPKMNESIAPPAMPLPGSGDATNSGMNIAPYFVILSP